jgi:hypothetical protein
VEWTGRRLVDVAVVHPDPLDVRAQGVRREIQHGFGGIDRVEGPLRMRLRERPCFRAPAGPEDKDSRVGRRTFAHENRCHAVHILVGGNHPARVSRVPRDMVRVVEWVG